MTFLYVYDDPDDEHHTQASSDYYTNYSEACQVKDQPHHVNDYANQNGSQLDPVEPYHEAWPHLNDTQSQHKQDYDIDGVVDDLNSVGHR